MRSIAQRHPMAVFLAIAYIAGAAIFALPLLATTGLGIIDLELPGVAPFVLLSAISLAGAAFVTTALAEGRDGVRSLRRRVFHFRVNPGWYALALVILPGAALATAVVFAGVEPVVKLVTSPGIVIGAVLGSVVAFVLVNLWEEAAWTGFALERLQPRLRADRRKRGHDVAPGPDPPAARVHRGWRDRWSRGSGAGPVLPRCAVHPPDPRPHHPDLALQPDRPQRADRRSGPRRSRDRDRQHLIPVLAPTVDPVFVFAGFAVLATVVLIATRGRLGLAPGASVERIHGGGRHGVMTSTRGPLESHKPGCSAEQPGFDVVRGSTRTSRPGSRGAPGTRADRAW